MNPVFRHRLIIIAAILFSGICWYFSNGLGGNFWFLLWIAPVPVLILSFKSGAKQSFIIAFISYLIGRLSWFSYLASVLFLVPSIIITILLPLIFALIVVITRHVVIKTNSWLSLFAFPLFFTSFEFILMRSSSDGSAGSIAYSQSDMLPLIQIASVTGIPGITFLVTFIPSAVAISWYFHKQNKELKYITAISLFIILSVFLFGIIRINTNSEKNSIKAGLVVLEEKFHNKSGDPDIKNEKRAVGYYAGKVSILASMGAELIVLPERAVDLRKETEAELVSILCDAARQNNVFIIAGYSNFRIEPAKNSALVIDGNGKLISDYDKVHLVKGLERQFIPGSGIGLFNTGSIHGGTAICKDLDFPEYIRKYGKSDIRILCIPAWDFVKDDWLHSRMAVLRGVENGFSEVRTARSGRLTISDCLGRVTSEASSSNGKESVLIGEVSLKGRNTLYSRFGDWFGIACLIASTGMLLTTIIRKKQRQL